MLKGSIMPNSLKHVSCNVWRRVGHEKLLEVLRQCGMVLALCCAGFAQSTSVFAPESASQPVSQSASQFLQQPEKKPVAALQPLQPGDSDFTALSADQRASLFFKGYLGSPATYYEPAATATGGLIANVPEEWHRTWGGYSRRVGNSFALFTMEAAMHDAGDAALGLDPRYFRCRCAGLWHRSGHALKMTLFAYDSSGNNHLDLPRIVGDYGSAMIVTTWYPAHYSPLVQGVQLGHVQLGMDAGVNLLREFSPELNRFLHKLKPRSQD